MTVDFSILEINFHQFWFILNNRVFILNQEKIKIPRSGTFDPKNSMSMIYIISVMLMVLAYCMEHSELEIKEMKR